MNNIRQGDTRERWPEVRRGWLVLFAFAVQVVAISLIADPSAVVLKKTVLAATAAMLFIGLMPNLRWWSFRVVAIGLLLNVAVMAANGGLMPATVENVGRVLPAEEVEKFQMGQTPPGSKNVLMAEESIRLQGLSDVIPVAWPVNKVYSIGDLLLFAGLALFFLEVVAQLVLLRRSTPHKDSVAGSVRPSTAHGWMNPHGSS